MLMKRVFFLAFSLFLSVICFAQLPVTERKLEEFKDMKLGLFLHWGLYSQAGGDWQGRRYKGGEHFMLYERIPLKEYATLAGEFNPYLFDADRWVEDAMHAGMKYLVITTKHHEGFAMFDSKCSDYNIVKMTPYGKDPLKALADACHRHGMGLGLYYSLGRDWEDPDCPTDWPEKGGRSNTWDYPDEDAKDISKYLERKVFPQVTELLTNYGKVDIMWFDTAELVDKDQSRALRDLVHTLQPECLINDRIGNGMGDYATVEQKLTPGIDPKPWEACMTMGWGWGYNKYDRKYKTPVEIIRYFTDIVSKGGNLLLNIGPKGDGSWPDLCRDNLAALHDWLEVNGEAIYGTRQWRTFGEGLDSSFVREAGAMKAKEGAYEVLPEGIIPDFRYTSKGRYVYVLVRNVPLRDYTLKAFDEGDRIRSVRLLSGKRRVKWNLSSKGLDIHLDSPADHEIYVLKIKLKKSNQ